MGAHECSAADVDGGPAPAVAREHKKLHATIVARGCIESDDASVCIEGRDAGAPRPH